MNFIKVIGLIRCRFGIVHNKGMKTVTVLTSIISIKALITPASPLCIQKITPASAFFYQPTPKVQKQQLIPYIPLIIVNMILF